MRAYAKSPQSREGTQFFRINLFVTKLQDNLIRILYRTACELIALFCIVNPNENQVVAFWLYSCWII